MMDTYSPTQKPEAVMIAAEASKWLYPKDTVRYYTLDQAAAAHKLGAFIMRWCNTKPECRHCDEKIFDGGIRYQDRSYSCRHCDRYRNEPDSD
jgi:hypothetical protein